MEFRDPTSGLPPSLPGYDALTPPRYIKRTNKMVEAAKLYHDNLQTQDIPPTTPQERRTEITLATARLESSFPKKEFGVRPSAPAPVKTTFVRALP